MASAADPDQAPVVLDRRPGVSGELALRRAGNDYELVVDGCFLMDTRDGRSERVLARVALAAVPDPRRVLVGGLGLGFTLAAVLADPRVDRVDVAELEPVLVGWHRTFLQHLSGDALSDRRTRLLVGDVLALIGSAPAGSWDVICLDIDNGPDWLARPENTRIYAGPGVRALARALDPCGALAVWSAAPAPRLEARLREVFADVRAVAVESRTTRPDWILLASGPPVDGGQPPSATSRIDRLGRSQAP